MGLSMKSPPPVMHQKVDAVLHRPESLVALK